MGFQDFEHFRSRHPAIRTTGLLTFTLAGLSPAEHTSVYWSLQPHVLVSELQGEAGRVVLVGQKPVIKAVERALA